MAPCLDFERTEGSALPLLAGLHRISTIYALAFSATERRRFRKGSRQLVYTAPEIRTPVDRLKGGQSTADPANHSIDR